MGTNSHNPLRAILLPFIKASKTRWGRPTQSHKFGLRFLTTCHIWHAFCTFAVVVMSEFLSGVLCPAILAMSELSCAMDCEFHLPGDYELIKHYFWLPPLLLGLIHNTLIKCSLRKYEYMIFGNRPVQRFHTIFVPCLLVGDAAAVHDPAGSSD